MRVLVVGFGSIGQRHALILGESHEVYVVSRRKIEGFLSFTSLEQALQTCEPDYVILASATCDHLANLAELSEYRYAKTLMVEKPLLSKNVALPHLFVSRAAVGYNLRFHPTVKRLKEVLLKQPSVRSASFYVGQHIADWRPGRKYQSTYSARINQGGGVLRDLSHELDLARYLFGELVLTDAVEGRRAQLDVDIPHEVTVVGNSASCPHLTIKLNCIDRPAQRWIEVQTSNEALRADLLTGELARSTKTELHHCERDETYKQMHLEILSASGSEFATIHDGLQVMRMISEIERLLSLVAL